MIGENLETRAREELFINVNPIQAAGKLTPEAMKALISYGDGYSTCDWCRKPFRLDKIDKPPIAEFHLNLAKFVGMDEARVVPGARRGFQAVVSTLVDEGDTVIVSALSHYTEFLSVEQAGGTVREVPLSDDNIHTGKNTAQKIEQLKKETGALPRLIIADHFDYMLGNEHEVEEIAKVADDYSIPFLYNGAYSIGVMPINGKKIGADFVVGSGHKSFASPAPSGMLATTDKWADKVFRTTEEEGDVTGRNFGLKEVEMLGCTLMGSNLIAMMASFPRIKERVKDWNEEVDKANYLMEELLKIEGTEILSEMPRKHTLVKVNTQGSFDKIAKKHDRRGYFLYDELKDKGIVGIFPGATRKWKMNTYGLTWKQVKYLARTFKQIARKYDLNIKE